jgi:hypothetical protein
MEQASGRALSESNAAELETLWAQAKQQEAIAAK